MLKLLKKFTGKEWFLTFLALVFIILQVWLELIIPSYMSEITTIIQMSNSTINEIIIAGSKMILCALGSFLASIVTAIISSRVASNFSANLREQLFDKVQSFSMEEIGQFSTPSLITRSTNDITQVQMFIVMGLQLLIKAPITATWAILKISCKEWQWTLAISLAVIILLTVVSICIIIAMPKFKMLQKLTDDVNKILRENLTGIRVVRAYNAEKYQEDKFDVVNDKLVNAHLFAQRTMAFLLPSIQIIMGCLPLAIYWIGAILIDSVSMTEKLTLFSDLIVFSQYALQIVMAFMILVMIFIMLPRSSVAAKRILEVFNTESKIIDGTFLDGKEEHIGELEFRNVSFKYPDSDEYVIKNINFSVKKGETVALIGSTGCGKSTIINLIPRFFDVTEGEVLVNGRNVKEYSQESLRNKLGYVSQKAVLFSGTINTNVAYGYNGKGEFLKEDVVDSVYVAQADEFVEKMSDSYDGYVAQGGSNLSGGQKQRISIARAICRKPEIFIFDDSFSALDYKTDSVLRNALNKECSDSTKVIVAQRINTISNADKIIVLDEGCIVGMGTHDELMQNCEVYQQISLSQFSREELE